MAQIIIAGLSVEGASTAAVHSPWDGSTVGEVGQAGQAQLETAIQRAVEAAPALAAMPSHRRRDHLRAISDGIAKRRAEISLLIAKEAGKPIAQARVEVDRAVQTFALGAEEATRLGGDAMSLDLGPSSEGYVGAWTRVPAGPVLAITPFNFPLNLVAHKLAPAFALGAPVVLKPAPQTPLTSMLLGEIVKESGAPGEWLSVVPTSNALAEWLVRDPRFAVISFTGSAKVGWMIKERAGKKRVLLELGGNAAAIVEPDADMEHALGRLVSAAFAYAGQVCIKVQRIFVHEQIAEKFTTGLVERTRKLAVGDPADPATLCGPLIDDAAAERVKTWLDEATSRGARVLVGGARERNRITPAVVADAPEGVRLVDEEVFGPVVTVHPYREIGEAIAAIERGRYGLQAGLFTQRMATVTQTFRSLHVGALVVNDAPTFRVDSMPYGGVKDSGLGREGVRFAIEEMSEKRLLVIRT